MLSGLITAVTALLPNFVIAATCDPNQICINEADDNGQSFYEVINNSSTQIFGFAIYNKGIDALTISTSEAGWSGKTVSQSAWDGRVLITFDDGRNWLGGLYDSSTPWLLEADHLGTFNQTFSENMIAGNIGANFYWNNAAKPSASSDTSSPLNGGITLSKFYYIGTTLGDSSFVAFDSNGNAIESLINRTSSLSSASESTVSLVPEPESYLMILAGLGLLGFMSKRKKS